MSQPRFDESDLQNKLIATLADYVSKFGQPPVSTAILFEPYHEAWGIYHAAHIMPIADGDSPGDYDVHNAEVGEITPPDEDYDRAEFEATLKAAGERLALSIDTVLRPTQLAINLDYDWLCAFPNNEFGKANKPAHTNPDPP